MPRSPGVYALVESSGRVRWLRVREMNGDLYATLPGGFLWIFSALVPLDLVEGEWL